MMPSAESDTVSLLIFDTEFRFKSPKISPALRSAISLMAVAIVDEGVDSPFPIVYAALAFRRHSRASGFSSSEPGAFFRCGNGQDGQGWTAEEEPSMKCQCPNCGAASDVPEAYCDRKIKCTRCREGFMPSSNLAPPEPPSVPAPPRKKWGTGQIVLAVIAAPFVLLFGLGALGAILGVETSPEDERRWREAAADRRVEERKTKEVLELRRAIDDIEAERRWNERNRR